MMYSACRVQRYENEFGRVNAVQGNSCRMQDGCAFQHALHIEQDVAMAEHDAFGPAGGAGGVNDGGQCVAVNRFDA